MGKLRPIPCRVDHCPELAPPRRLFCPGHWVALPSYLREQLAATYPLRNGGQGYRYLSAEREAIRWLNERQFPDRRLIG